MKNVNLFLFIMGLNTFCLFSQTPDPLDFWPNHPGDIWQYRQMFTGELAFTETFQKDSTDISGNKFVWYKRTGLVQPGNGLYKLDTSYNLFQSFSLINPIFNVLLYKLDADSGDIWIYLKTPDDSIFAEVIDIYPSTIYGNSVVIKKIQYTRYSSTGQFWVGNRYIASGFGLFKWEVEPSDVFYLSGAFIDSTLYGTITSVEEINQPPDNFDVITNYPNPFNSSTIISYSISKNSDINISVYDLLGRKLKTLTNEYKQKGSYEINFEANDLATGIYIIVLRTDKNFINHKILLLK